jgi:hypothetical protein
LKVRIENYGKKFGSGLLSPMFAVSPELLLELLSLKKTVNAQIVRHRRIRFVSFISMFNGLN